MMLTRATGVPLQSSLDTDAMVVLALAFLGGLGLIYWGFRTYRTGRLIRDTPTEKVRSVAVGRTEIEGTARPDEYVLDRPFTDGKCLYASYKIEEYRRDASDDDNDKDWDTILSNTVAAPFYLDDGTGEILVAADSSATFEISDEYSEKTTISGASNPPAKVQEFLSGSGGMPSSAVTDTLGNIMGSMGGFASGGGATGGAGEGRESMASEPEPTAGDQPSPSIAQDEAAMEALQSMDEGEMEAVQRGERDPPPELQPYVGEDGDMAQALGLMGAGGLGEFLDAGGVAGSDGTADNGATGNDGETADTEQSITHIPRSDLNTGSTVLESDVDVTEDEDSSLLDTIRSTASTVSEFASSGGVSDSRNKRRYTEEILPVEEDTYVYGGAKQQDVDLSATNEQRVKVGEDSATGKLIISDYGESEIASAYTKRAVLYIVGGLVVSAGALGILANGFGL